MMKVGLKTSGLMIDHYVDDVSSFAMLGVHLLMLATSNAMQICN